MKQGLSSGNNPFLVLTNIGMVMSFDFDILAF